MELWADVLHCLILVVALILPPDHYKQLTNATQFRRCRMHNTPRKLLGHLAGDALFFSATGVNGNATRGYA